MQLGYTMLCAQTAPKQLVSDLARAEEIGFDFSVFAFAEQELPPAVTAAPDVR